MLKEHFAVLACSSTSRTRLTRLIGSLTCIAFLATPGIVLASDEAAARDLAQSSGCFKCHGVDKKKDGPALRDVAAKYKGVADAETKLIYHVTSGEMVKFDDGHEEHHKKVKTNSPNDTRNLVQWVLGLEGGTKP
jgi:cytochrome c